MHSSCTIGFRSCTVHARSPCVVQHCNHVCGADRAEFDGGVKRCLSHLALLLAHGAMLGGRPNRVNAKWKTMWHPLFIVRDEFLSR